MSNLPISAEARGAVRAFKANLRRADVIFQARFQAESASREAARYVSCGATGRARALLKLRRQFGTPDRYLGGTPVWAHLRPRDAVIVEPRDAGQAQDAVVLEYLTLNGGDLETGLWTLEVPDHALARAAQRSRGLDLYSTIIAAHRHLLTVRCDPLPTGDVLVPAGPGAFIGQMVYGQEQKAHGVVVYFRPRTWLHEDQLGDTQVPLPADGPGQAWGEGPLLPFPLRSITVAGGHLSVHRRVA